MQINVLEYFELGALTNHADKTAVVDQERRFTFSEIGRCAKNCAAMILQRTSELNRPIAVFLPKSAETVIADLGILYSGNCYANLDLKTPSERLKATIKNLEPSLIISSSAHLHTLRDLGVPDDRVLLVEAAMAPGSFHDSDALISRLDGVIDTDPLCIIHTSGSTGIPKGVALNHRSTVDFMDWVFQRLKLDGSEVVGSLSPFYFDIYTLELHLCLAKGATLVIVPEQCATFPLTLLEFMNSHAISFIFWVPTIMVNIANQDLFSVRKLETLRKVFFAGEVFPTKSLNYWRRHLPGVQFVNLYGPIEICVDCTYFIVDREMADEEKLPIGFPCRNTDILILDDRNQSVQGTGMGELCVRGSSIALGYWNDPDRTAEAFVQNPLNPHYPERIYRTGDLVHRNERGELMIVGRKDFQIKHLGYRIELGDIEHAVMRLEAIRNACVVYNRDKKEIILYFESAQELSSADIRALLAPFLPKYMLPSAFHRLEVMPRNPNGKIDRQLLARRVA